METQEFAQKMRKLILDQVYAAKSGHPGGSLSAVNVMAMLYNEIMNISVDNIDDENRDRFVLSKGHASPALYAALSLKGFIPEEELKTFRSIDGRLEGHPDMNKVKGVEMSTGSLGQGVSAACGMALVGKRENRPYNVYTLLGDGETEEGQVWEAMMFAGHYGLDNLCVIIDYNHLQIDGEVDDVMSPMPLAEKLFNFGFNVIKIDGDSLYKLGTAFKYVKEKMHHGRPVALLADTTKGFGVSFMEGNFEWHGKAPNEEEYKKAIAEVTQNG